MARALVRSHATQLAEESAAHGQDLEKGLPKNNLLPSTQIWQTASGVAGKPIPRKRHHRAAEAVFDLLQRSLIKNVGKKAQLREQRESAGGNHVFLRRAGAGAPA